MLFTHLVCLWREGYCSVGCVLQIIFRYKKKATSACIELVSIMPDTIDAVFRILYYVY